jgi:uroporphyrinogen decarboxylase
VRLLGVSASALQVTGWQEPLLDRERRSTMEKLYKGIDQLRKKYGEDAYRRRHATQTVRLIFPAKLHTVLPSSIRNMPQTTHTFLAACRREPTSFTPVWLMRQAGRYMEEYRKLRAQYGFLDLCKKPDLATEITVTPVQRLGVDAAILFADILLILEPMGVGLEYSKGDGPVIHRPVRSGKDIDGLKDSTSSASCRLSTKRLEKLQRIKKQSAADRLRRRAVHAGFLSHRRQRLAQLHPHQRLFYGAPEAWKRLMERLAKVIGEYLNCQIAAGAEVVQIFDSWAGCLTPFDYQQFVQPYTKAVIDALMPGTPVIISAPAPPAY